MRILSVTSSYPKFPGDVTAPFIESITRGLVARGHAIDLVLPEHPELKRPSEPGLRFFPYRYAPHARWALWGYAQSLESDVRVRQAMYGLAPLVAAGLRRSVSSLILANSYDVALLHWVIPNAVLVADLLETHRLGSVVSLHGSDVFVAERSALGRLLAGRVLRRAAQVTACSSDLLMRARRLGAVASRSRTLPYGVDVQAFTPFAGDPALRTRLGFGEEAVLVLAIGRLVEKKGFRYLIEAAARVAPVHVLIAGDGDLRAELEMQARSLGAPVTFLGSVERSRLSGLLATVDIVAVPSVVDRAGNVDGLPNTLLEALAAGRAVVASRVAGIPEVIDDGVNGVLVPPRDVPGLADALRRLAGDAEARRRLGSRARADALARLTWEKHVSILEECLVAASALATR
jgi:glycosyltransferase involved in cell wall biosynthesis